MLELDATKIAFLECRIHHKNKHSFFYEYILTVVIIGGVYMILSCIITFFHEGYLAHTTLSSLQRAREYAEQRQVAVEFVYVLDDTDTITEKIVTEHPAMRSTDIILHVANHDVGLSRNDGIHVASGDYIMTCDGDDLYSEKSMYAAVMQASAVDSCIAIPRYCINFGAINEIYVLPEIDAGITLYDFVVANPFVNCITVHKKIFEQIAYTASGNGFGFEDWNWHVEALARNFIYKTVEDYVLFYRRKYVTSINNKNIASAAVIPRSSFFASLPVADPGIPEQIKEKNDRIRAIKYVVRNILQYLPDSMDKVCLRLLKWGYRRCSRVGHVSSCAEQHMLNMSGIQAVRVDMAKHILPELHPSIQGELPVYSYVSNPYPGMVYAALYQAIRVKDEVDLVLVVPWLKAGGADLMTINFANSMAACGKCVLVITTLLQSSPWRGKLAPQVEFLDAGMLWGQLSDTEQELIFVRLLLQLAPRVVHCINSDLCLRVIKKFGYALRNSTRLVVSLFCDDLLPDGTPVGYAQTYLRDLDAIVDKWSSDNSQLPLFWQKQMGVPADRFSIVYGVAAVSDACGRRDGGAVLWAGRLDTQKRPDMLFKIASLMPQRQFHVYGSALLDSEQRVIRQITSLPNVLMHGAYDGFGSIPLQGIGCLLYTTAFDGLPNVLLEAASVGLPIVAPLIGGIGDLVRQDTAWPVPATADAPAYVDALERLFRESDEAAVRADRMRKLIAKRHSWEMFTQSLLCLYCCP